MLDTLSMSPSYQCTIRTKCVVRGHLGATNVNVNNMLAFCRNHKTDGLKLFVGSFPIYMSLYHVQNINKNMLDTPSMSHLYQCTIRTKYGVRDHLRVTILIVNSFTVILPMMEEMVLMCSTDLFLQI